MSPTILNKRLTVCLGAGGVGKTTVSAALALASARQRKRSAVITVDPARRLKDALGIGELDGEPRSVHYSTISFDALALDTKHTFDELIRRFAPSQTIADAILANRLYRELSGDLAGSAEYMAMEKLHELFHLDHYDRIVIDTPPSANVDSLLDAPRRLGALLASQAVSLLQAPSRLLSLSGSRLGQFTLSTLLKALERWTGMSLIKDLSDFVGNFEGLIDGFQGRARDVEELLASDETAFLLVTTLEPDTVDTTIELARGLQEGKFPVAGIIVNRVLTFPDGDSTRIPADLVDIERKLQKNYRELAEISEYHLGYLDKLLQGTQLPLLATIPARNDRPTSVAALSELAAVIEAELGL